MSLVIHDHAVILNGTDTTTYCHPTAVSSFLSSIVPIIEKINEIPLDELAPGPITNSLFSALVALVCRIDLSDDEVVSVLSNCEIIQQQRRLMDQCASAEFLLESTFAREIRAGNKTAQDFPYYENYISLVQFEMDSLKFYCKNLTVNHVAVIGSGPLPLTTVEMLKHLPENVMVTNFDHSDEAIELSTVVVSYNKNLFVKKRTALEITAQDLDGVNLVHLAALVGIRDDEKKDVIDHLYNVMQPGSVLMARSALGLKTLLYKRLSTVECGRFLNLQEFHPEDRKVINSIICGMR